MPLHVFTKQKLKIIKKIYIIINLYQPNLLVAKQCGTKYTWYDTGSKNFILAIVGKVYSLKKKIYIVPCSPIPLLYHFNKK